VSKLWRSLNGTVKQIVPIAINVVEAVKSVNESLQGDAIEFVLNQVLPDNGDEALKMLRLKLSELLPKILNNLVLISDISSIEDEQQKIKSIILAINFSDDTVKNAFYHSLSVLIIEALSDGQLTWSESVQIAEYYYKNIKT
jgi:hypothetical protein